MRRTETGGRGVGDGREGVRRTETGGRGVGEGREGGEGQEDRGGMGAKGKGSSGVGARGGSRHGSRAEEGRFRWERKGVGEDVSMLFQYLSLTTQLPRIPTLLPLCFISIRIRSFLSTRSVFYA